MWPSLVPERVNGSDICLLCVAQLTLSNYKLTLHRSNTHKHSDFDVNAGNLKLFKYPKDLDSDLLGHDTVQSYQYYGQAQLGGKRKVSSERLQTWTSKCTSFWERWIISSDQYNKCLNYFIHVLQDTSKLLCNSTRRNETTRINFKSRLWVKIFSISRWRITEMRYKTASVGMCAGANVAPRRYKHGISRYKWVLGST